MKLWQKIFLLTLALVIAVVNICSLIILSNNHNLTIERERQEALSRHNYIVVEMQNRIIYTQLLDRVVTLNDERTLEVVRDVLSRQRSDSALSISLFRDRVALYSVNQVASLADTEIALLSEPDSSSVITSSGDSSYLVLASTVLLNNTPYQLVSSFNITSTYQLFDADLDMVSIISVISGLLVAGILLILIQGLLRPLRNLSTTTRRIAQGDLEKRALVRGHDEVSEVAQNFNIMADAIELNVTELKDVAEARRLFISNLAHEMKTPLTSILGFADLLRIKRSVSDEERQEYTGIIVAETKRLQSLSGKLMELLALKKLQLSFEEIDSVEFTEQVKRTLSPLLEYADIILTTKVAPLSFIADQELLTSLIYNLIDNAVKASPPGNSVELSFEPLEDTKDFFLITVADKGAGIPANQIPLLTEPFYMLDKARTRKHGGAGLGLALCVEIAQVHNATLTIESDLGQGTRVLVVFPVDTQDLEAQQTEKERADVLKGDILEGEASDDS